MSITYPAANRAPRRSAPYVDPMSACMCMVDQVMSQTGERKREEREGDTIHKTKDSGHGHEGTLREFAKI